jgi:hypothetical protein
MTVTYAADNAAFAYSPFNWLVGGGQAKTIAGGAYVRAMFTGTTLVLNFSAAPSGQTAAPEMSAVIDGQPTQLFTMAPSVTLTVPAGIGTHSLEIRSRNTDQGPTTSWWTSQADGIYFNGVTLDAGASVSRPIVNSKKILVLGDSVPYGYNAISAGGSPNLSHDCTVGWAFLLRGLLGVEVGSRCVPGQGYLVVGDGVVPALGAAFASLWSGQPAMVGDGIPDMVVIQSGGDDLLQALGGNTAVTPAAIQTAVTAAILAIAAAYPTSPIAVLSPCRPAAAASFPAATVQAFTTALIAGVAAANNPNVVMIDASTFQQYADATAADGIHPLAAVQVLKTAPMIANVLRPILFANGQTSLAKRFSFY